VGGGGGAFSYYCWREWEQTDTIEASYIQCWGWDRGREYCLLRKRMCLSKLNLSEPLLELHLSKVLSWHLFVDESFPFPSTLLCCHLRTSIIGDMYDDITNRPHLLTESSRNHQYHRKYYWPTMLFHGIASTLLVLQLSYYGNR